jgi:hypothetical protein
MATLFFLLPVLPMPLLRGMTVHLQARTLHASELQLDTCQERHHPQVWDVSNACNQWLERRGMYLLAASAHAQEATRTAFGRNR